MSDSIELKENVRYSKQSNDPSLGKKRIPQKSLLSMHELNSKGISREIFSAGHNGDLQRLANLLNSLPSSAINALDRHEWGLLHYAVKFNNSSVITCLLGRGANVNLKGAHENSPLHLAAKYNKAKSAEILLKQPSIIINAGNGSSETALIVACRNNNLTVAELLVKYGSVMDHDDRNNYTALHYVCRNNNIELLDLLMKQDIRMNLRNINGLTPMMIICIEGLLNLFQAFTRSVKSKQKNIADILNTKSPDGHTCLMFAIQGIHNDIVEECLKEGADPNASTSKGLTCLQLASSCGNVKAVQLLLTNGADANVVDAEGKSALIYCAMYNHVEIGDVLLKAGAISDITDLNMQNPVHIACEKGYQEFVQLLLLNSDLSTILKRDHYMRTPLHLVVKNNNLELALILLKKLNHETFINEYDEDDCTPLHYATENKNVDMCKLLVSYEASTLLENSQEQFPIHIAASSGDVKCLSYFIEDVDMDQLRLRDGRGRTPLLCAIEGSHADAVNYLLEKGSNVRVRMNDGCNALMLAARAGNIEIMKVFIAAGLSVDLHDNLKNTALHYSANSDSAECFKLLLNHGASMTRNGEDQSPVDLALDVENGEVSRLIFTDEFLPNYKEPEYFDKLIHKNANLTKKILDSSIIDISENSLDSFGLSQYNFSLLDPGPDNLVNGKRYFAIKTMIKAKQCHLLQHPLCKAILKYKWQTFGRYFFIVDSLLYLLYLACLTGYCIIHQRAPGGPNIIVDPKTGCEYNNHTATISGNEIGKDRARATAGIIAVQIILYVLIGFRVCVEIGKMATKKLGYLADAHIYFYWVLYLLTILFIRNPVEEPCLYEWSFGIAAICLAWGITIFHFEHISVTRLYVLMFQSILVSLTKVLMLFSVLILGFALGFQICLAHTDHFKNFGYGFLKTLDMTIGELEFSEYFLGNENEHFRQVSLVMFAIFSIMMPIALMNLLIALAIGDIEGVRNEATLKSIALTAKFVWEIETNFPPSLQRFLYRKHVDLPRRIPPKRWKTIYASLFGFEHRVEGQDEDFPEDVMTLLLSVKDKLNTMEDNFHTELRKAQFFTGTRI